MRSVPKRSRRTTGVPHGTDGVLYPYTRGERRERYPLGGVECRTIKPSRTEPCGYESTVEVSQKTLNDEWLSAQTRWVLPVPLSVVLEALPVYYTDPS